MTYQPNPNRYNDMPYRRCGKSGLLLPAVSLGLGAGHGGELSADELWCLGLHPYAHGGCVGDVVSESDFLFVSGAARGAGAAALRLAGPFV